MVVLFVCLFVCFLFFVCFAFTAEQAGDWN